MPFFSRSQRALLLSQSGKLKPVRRLAALGFASSPRMRALIEACFEENASLVTTSGDETTYEGLTPVGL